MAKKYGIEWLIKEIRKQTKYWHYDDINEVIKWYWFILIDITGRDKQAVIDLQLELHKYYRKLYIKHYAKIKKETQKIPI